MSHTFPSTHGPQHTSHGIRMFPAETKGGHLILHRQFGLDNSPALLACKFFSGQASIFFTGTIKP